MPSSSRKPKDTPRLAEPLKSETIRRLAKAIKASGLPKERVPKKAGVSRAALYRALAGGPVLARTRAKLIAWIHVIWMQVRLGKASRVA